MKRSEARVYYLIKSNTIIVLSHDKGSTIKDYGIYLAEFEMLNQVWYIGLGLL